MGGHLFGLPDSVSPVKYGVRLKNLLDGEAADIVKHLVILSTLLERIGVMRRKEN